MSTRQLADGLHRLAADGLPQEVREAALRSLLNVVGTAVGAARTTEVDLLVAHGRAVGALGGCPVPGRFERFDAPNAALITGFAAHVDDFDDTHLATVVHPGAAVYAAALPLLSRGGCDRSACSMRSRSGSKRSCAWRWR